MMILNYEFKIIAEHPQTRDVKEEHIDGHWAAERKLYDLKQAGYVIREDRIAFREKSAPQGLCQKLAAALKIMPKNDKPWTETTIDDFTHYLSTLLV